MKDTKTVVLSKKVKAVPACLELGDEVQLQRVQQNKLGGVIMIFKLVSCIEGERVLLNKEFAVELSELA